MKRLTIALSSIVLAALLLTACDLASVGYGPDRDAAS